MIQPNGYVESLRSLLEAHECLDHADERVYYLTIAVNAAAREGFEVVTIDHNTVVLRRNSSGE